jgi:hypothetical protein
MIEAHDGHMINRFVPQEDRETLLADLRNRKQYYLSEGDLSVFHRISDDRRII